MKFKDKALAEKIVNILLDILVFVFSIILLISIYTGIQTKIFGNDYADFFGYSIFEVQTGSMEDAISVSDWIVVKKSDKFKLNDIVTYELDGEYVTHRIIEVYNGTYVTKGDANNAKDEPISQNQIVGKVVKILGKIGIIKKVLFNPAVLIAVIITLFLCSTTFNKKKDGSNSKITIFKNNVIKKLKEKQNKPKNERVKTVIKNKKTSEIETLKDKEEIHVEQVSGNSDENELLNNYELPTDLTDLNNDELEEELAKTMLFRVVPVDSSEINDTLLEIAKNELKNEQLKPKEKQKVITGEEEVEEVEDDSLTKINLEMLENKKNKKSKNIIEKVMSIKTEELTELINAIDDDEKTKVNEATIKTIFTSAYIESKYYNNYGNKDSNSKNKLSKIQKFIKNVGIKLVEDYKGSDTKYSDKVNKYIKIFNLITSLDQANDTIDEIKVKNEFIKQEIEKYANDNWNDKKITDLVSQINKIQRNYVGIIDYFLKKLETNMFELNLNQLKTRKSLYGLELKHNISFSRVYSDYIVDKTYSEGIIAEDKMIVLLNLLLVQLVKDMTSYNFNKKYVLYIPESLYSKEVKFEKLLRMIEDDYAKENVLILVSYEELVRNQKFIKSIKKMGYKFALVFDKDVNIKSSERGYIYLADYIFANKKRANIERILPSIPEELLEKLVYEDIIDKVGDFEVNGQ